MSVGIGGIVEARLGLELVSPVEKRDVMEKRNPDPTELVLKKEEREPRRVPRASSAKPKGPQWCAVGKGTCKSDGYGWGLVGDVLV